MTAVAEVTVVVAVKAVAAVTAVTSLYIQVLSHKIGMPQTINGVLFVKSGNIIMIQDMIHRRQDKTILQIILDPIQLIKILQIKLLVIAIQRILILQEI